MGGRDVGLEPVHYLVTRKNRHHGEAIAEGFGARTVPAEGDGQEPRERILHLVGGLQHGSLELLMDIRAMGLPYVFFDRAYFGGGPGSNRLRATRNAYQKNWVEERPRDRLDALGVRLAPWRREGRHLLVVPPSEAVCRLFGLGDWEARIRARLVATGTRRAIWTTYKGDPRPLSERLDGCHAVVTWTSNVAVEAIVAGVPAFVGAASAAAPVATPLECLGHMLERPLMPPREAWAASLAWGQFTLEEIRSGFAKAVVLQGQAVAA